MIHGDCWSSSCNCSVKHFFRIERKHNNAGIICEKQQSSETRYSSKKYAVYEFYKNFITISIILLT